MFSQLTVSISHLTDSQTEQDELWKAESTKALDCFYVSFLSAAYSTVDNVNIYLMLISPSLPS